MPWAPPYLQWVVKVSKHCNLRCRYCYEFPFLDDKTRMRLDQLEAMFHNIANAFAGTGRRQDFVWHGGEPLLAKPSYYQAIHEMQEHILGTAGVSYTNSMQTNLTILTPDVLKLMREFFSHVGVSIDLFGDQRVDLRGRPAEPRVLENMQVLLDEGIHFGCISVLSRVNVAHTQQIYGFFEDIGVSFRLLPFYRTGFAGQQEPFALSDTEITDAFCRVVDHWLASESSIQVQPIQDYIIHVLRRLDGGEGWRRYYDKLAGEVVMIVDTDGRVFSNGDAYDAERCHGNITEQPWDQLRSSRGFKLALSESLARLDATCASCRFHGACSGYFMAEATPEQRVFDSVGRLHCGVAKPVQEYIERVLVGEGVVDVDAAALRLDRIAELAASTPPEYL
ncbi:radical SAM protein [Nocardia abscessus]|uniref:radical SAM protein n=1 Tax=Nocardia abscessus TaxID=120957 RepID=UPI0024584445|nr:radical SAM protein [Nocardia abscessus]